MRAVRILALLILGGFVEAHASPLDGARLPIGYRTWTVKSAGEETTVSQLFAPASASLRLGETTDLVLATGGASSRLEPGGASSQSLSGWSDLTAQLFQRFGGERALVELGVNVPAGKKELSLDELAVLRALAHPVFGFRLKEYGEGFDVSGGAAAAVPLGERVHAGVGVGFVRHGEYRLLQDGDDYLPASELAFSAGIDVEGEGGGDAPPARAVHLDATYRIFGDDELASEAIFEEGNQLELETYARSVGGAFGATALLRAVIKSDNTRVLPSGETIQSIKASSGDAVTLRGGLDRALGSRWRAGLEGELIRFSGSESSIRDGSAWGVGPTVVGSLGGSGSVRLRALALGGSIDGASGEPQLDLSGFDVSAAIVWSPPR